MQTQFRPFSYVFSLLCVLLLLSGCALKHSKPNEPAGLRDESPFARAEYEAAQEEIAQDDSADDEEDEDDNAIAAESEKGDENPSEVETLVASESRSQAEMAADDEAGKTFPLVTNEFVDSWIKYFTGRGRPVMEKWLARSTRYIPMMKQVLREKGMPEDLIYLSMIESGFNPKAKSRAKAVGPWQFIKPTGQRYGLKVQYWVDERRDYRKSTFAAAEYLGELHDIFGSWYLAAAAYNAGEGKVLSAVRRDRTRNFWELARKKKKNFRAETRNYVPKIIAAALVSKNPEKYGFKNIPYEQPLKWETVNVPSGVSIKQVATLIGADEETLDILNTELRREITPPGNDTYPLRLPPEKKQLLVDNLSNLQSKRIGNFMEYTIRKGDTLSTISRRFGTDVEVLRELNKLTRNSLLRPGRELIVPVGSRFAGEDSGSRRNKKESVAISRAQNTSTNNQSTNNQSANNQSANNQSANNQSANNQSANNQSLKGSQSSPASSQSKVASTSSSSGQHVIQAGDSFWSIAKKYGVSIQKLRDANKGKASGSLRPGQTIVLPTILGGG